jgi:hypothetical protein
MAGNENDDVRARADEVDRYRRAAEEALNQLDWCVNYLYRVRKNAIAQVIEKNRSHIRRQMSEATREHA